MKKTAVSIVCLMLYTMPAAAEIDLQAYAKCSGFAVSQEPAPPEAETVCLGPANQGLPAAQYALGAILLSHEKYEDGLQWLEKAAANKLPPAAHLLGTVYVQSKDPSLQARGRDLLTYAICTGYPPAQEPEVKTAAGNPACSTSVVPFDGTWTGQLQWQKSNPSGTSGQLRVTVNAGAVKVFMQAGNDWVEAKPGRFTAQQVEDTLFVSTIDSGWDLDGKWVESWTIQILRTGADEATMQFVRTVNNIYMPESTGLKVFTSIAEGKATRMPS